MILRSYSSSALANYYDIIINGGGMIGSVLACTLAKNPTFNNFSILLIESGSKKAWYQQLSEHRNNFSNRVSSLNQNTKKLLEKIDLWDGISSRSCRNVNEMKIWGCGSQNIATTFRVRDVPNLENLAYIVENEVLIAAAMQNLHANDRVHVIHNNSVSEYNIPHSEEETVKLRTKDGSNLSCSLLLGADGFNSKVRQAIGAQYVSWDYKQQAVVATLKIQVEQENNAAWQKFVPNGPVALLPLSSEFSSLVWTTTPDEARKLLSLSNESFVDALNTVLWEKPVNDPFAANVTRAVSQLLKSLSIQERRQEIIPPMITDIVENSRASFPVGFGHAVSYVAPRVALVGDAAHRVHPLAGQGVNLGFGDITCLDEVLTKYVSIGGKLGTRKCLREYETLRQRSNVPKLVGIDLIQKVAGNRWSPLLIATNTALQVTDAIPVLKKYLIHSAAV